jgi:hypothetical protein
MQRTVLSVSRDINRHHSARYVPRITVLVMSGEPRALPL